VIAAAAACLAGFAVASACSGPSGPCGQGYSPVTFSYDDGGTVSGLTACTSSDQSRTVIANKSDDTVWDVTSPAQNYWTADSDLQAFANGSLSAKVALFRAGIRSELSPTDRTIEPGVTVTVPAAPSAIQLRQDPGVQATWEVASLLAESASDKANDAVDSLFKEDGSKTDDAMITCMSSGYSIGKSLADNGDSAQDIQSQLSGIYQSASGCGQAIKQAEDESRSKGMVPELTLPDVTVETYSDPVFTDAGDMISKAEDVAHDLVMVHEIH